MASFTPNKGLAQPTVGADVGQWGTELNGAMAILDNNLGGVAAVSLAGASGNVVATTGNAQCLVQNFTGALAGNVAYEVPALGAMYVCENNTTGAFTVTVKTTAAGSLGTVIPQGTAVAVFSDGTNVNPQTTPNPGSFSNLTVSGTLAVSGAANFSSTLSATGTIHTNVGITAGTTIAATGALSGGSVSSGSTVAATTGVTGATVSGSTSTTGGAFTLGTASITATLAQFLINGGTSGFAINNHANSAQNLVLDDSGNLTVRTNCGVGGTLTSVNVNISGAYETSTSLLTFIGGASGVNFANAADSANTVNWDNSGNTTIAGTVNAGGSVTSGGSVSVGGGGGFSGKLGTGGGLDGHLFNLQWNGSATELWIDASPTGIISVTSDVRVKDQIEYFDGDCISKVRALGVATFRYKDIGIFRDDGKRHLGFIAHEVQRIIPDAVSGDPDAVSLDGEILPQSLKPIPLIAMNTGAIQQLIARVEALEAALKDRHSMYQEGLPEWPAKTVFSLRERLMAKLRRLLKRLRGTPDA